MKKIVVLGGGEGLSCILSGLKLFPVDVTAIITVSDDGSSTGVLKEELDIPAVGDVGKVLLAMANVDADLVSLLRYRFDKSGSLHNHPVRNVMLAALIDIKGNLTEATKYMCKLLGVKGSVLPLTEEKVELIGRGGGESYYGEVAVSHNVKNIESLTYDRDFEVSQEVIDKITDADLIILSPGSLYTSILPHLIVPSVREAIQWSEAPVMYVSNLVSQPGETDGYSVADHVAVLNKYLGERSVNLVVANNGVVSPDIDERYAATGKSRVELDRVAVGRMGARIIEDDLVHIDEKGSMRHDELKTAYLIFSELMNQK